MSFFSSRRQNENSSASAPQRPQPPERGQPQALPAPSQPVGFETVLGANTVLEGTLRSSSNVRLDGTFTGTLEITGNVLVGETGKINADINARNISIAGAVRGNISGKKVQLLRTGRIWGDIHAQALTTEEGAFIDGKITMISRETPENAPPSAIAPPPVVVPPAVADVAPAINPPQDAITSAMIAAVTPSDANKPTSEATLDAPPVDTRLAFMHNDTPSDAAEKPPTESNTSNTETR
ncbi:MAG: polymer-forming cytoskeletal protein [Chloroflexota bacterium]|nr:polymer-forming cytoskeletal protein [Chloroflexota bacterium]